ncbi:hypothetical protein F2Q70_00044572 [Brassica cretica]|uniref:Uncharacterized protein n=1 Tax=Brassica cretica TaxID=69181 RepID=A0A8S9KKQ2_BRACR|nr:hypothetical protein F2Q70_00044572 [Brassica cretica]
MSSLISLVEVHVAATDAAATVALDDESVGELLLLESSHRKFPIRSRPYSCHVTSAASSHSVSHAAVSVKARSQKPLTRIHGHKKPPPGCPAKLFPASSNQA